jgi:hypothetical protein
MTIMHSKLASPSVRHTRRGDFEWQPVVGTFEPTAEDMHADRSYFGMLPEALYLWGTLRDDEGDLHTIMRRIPHRDEPGGSRRRLIIQSTIGGTDHLAMHAIGREAAPNDGFQRTLEGDRVRWTSAPDAPGRPFEVWWESGWCGWREEGTFDLNGTMVRPGLHWYLPGRDAGMYYVANIFELEGEIFGRHCRGLIGFDQIYMYEGGEVYKTKDALVGEKLELAWYTWATRYKDGTLDAGHFMLGNDRFGFAVLGDEHGNVRWDYDVNGEVTFGPDGYWHTGIRFSALGEEWEFIPDERGRMPDLGPIPNPQVEGRWRRVGDDREPDVWYAWGESAPSHGTRRTDRFA